jgi:MSHA biogenesis protein MshJ
VFLALLGALLFVSLQVVLPPLAAQQKRSEAELMAKREQIRSVYAQTEQLAAERGRDRDAANRERIAELKEQLTVADGGTGALTRGFVSPREMAALVEQVLKRNRALELVSIENLPPTALGEPAAEPARTAGTAKPAGEAAAGGPVVYRHGLRVEVKGEYANLVRYLQALETLDWKVLWDQARLEAEAYPVSRLTVVIYTLSTEQVWLGV